MNGIGALCQGLGDALDLDHEWNEIGMDSEWNEIKGGVSFWNEAA